jgi:hypothetical protein
MVYFKIGILSFDYLHDVFPSKDKISMEFNIGKVLHSKVSSLLILS